MESRSKLLWGLALGFLLGAVVGLVVGGYGGFHFATSHFGSEWLYEQAMDVESRVVILRHLRAGKTAQAMEILENQMEDDLISMEPDARIKAATISEINKAIRVSKEYRLAHPRKGKRPGIEKMLANVFSREPYK
jgi:hypothetical protein